MKDIDEEVTLNFEGVDKSIMLRRDEFIRMALPTDSGSIDMKNFGGWLRIGNDGLYVNMDHEHEVDLTPEEAAALCPHPTGNLNEPVLSFPFSIGEFESFLNFTNEVGLDVPLSRKKFEEIIALKSQKRKGSQAAEQPHQERTHQKTETKFKSKTIVRIEHIYEWFKEQNDFNADNLSLKQTGRHGARDACWKWLELKGLTRPGYIFDGALQNNSKKTKSFVAAWKDFLNDIKKSRPEN